MSEPSLPELEAERDRLYAQLGVVGDWALGVAPAEKTAEIGAFEPDKLGRKPQNECSSDYS